MLFFLVVIEGKKLPFTMMASGSLMFLGNTDF